jgi:hypothetical protein
MTPYATEGWGWGMAPTQEADMDDQDRLADLRSRLRLKRRLEQIQLAIDDHERA